MLGTYIRLRLGMAIAAVAAAFSPRAAITLGAIAPPVMRVSRANANRGSSYRKLVLRRRRSAIASESRRRNWERG